MSKYLRKKTVVGLSDDELRKRIFANASILFPSSSPNQFEIVYGSCPYNSGKTFANDIVESQYAVIGRRDFSGNFTPLIKGQVWTPTVPWTMVLQGLLDTTAKMIHKAIGSAPLPAPGFLEDLPRYEPPQEAPVAPATPSSTNPQVELTMQC